MMKHFDYIFYRVSAYYKYKWKDDTGPIYGVGVVVILQILHAILLLLVLAFLIKEVNYYFFSIWEGKTAFDNPLTLFISLSALGLNFYRYFKVGKFEELEDIWKDEPVSKRKTRGYLIILYIVLTLTITISVSMYRLAHF